MSDELELRDCPRHWPLKRLADVFDTQLGKMLSAKARTGLSSKPYLRNLNVQWGAVVTTDMIEMDFDLREKEKFRLRRGDLLMCEGGVPGRTAIWRNELDECYFQKAIHRLRPVNGTGLPEFYLYWFRYAFDVTNVYGVAGASSTIAHLPAAQLRSLIVPVPPLDEQRRIAAVLSAVQRAVERQERLVALTAELKKALMHKLFTEGTRGEPRKQTEIGPVPESWTVSPLGTSCELATGTTPPTAQSELYVGTNPFIRTDRIVNARIKTAEEFVSDEALGRYRLKTFPAGTVLLAMYGQGKTRGQVAILEMQASITQNAAAITCSSHLVPDFLFYYLMSQYRRLRQSGFAGQISHLNLGFLKGFPIPRPSIKEQRQIVQVLTSVEVKENLHQSLRRALQALFRTLLHQLMTAQVRVRDLDLSALEEAAHPAGAACQHRVSADGVALEGEKEA